MAGTFLSAVTQVVLERLFSRESVNFLNRSEIDPSLVYKLKTLLLAAEKVALYVEAPAQITDSAVREWLEEIQHWCYRAEDVIDDIATRALESSLESSPHQPPSLLPKALNFIDSVRHPSYAQIVTLNMEEIVSMLQSLLRIKDPLEFGEISTHKLPPQRVPTIAFLEDDKLYGRDEERDEILEFLLSDDEPEGDHSRVGGVAILGMDGIGKTVLAKLVFNDERLSKAFNPRVWVRLSNEFDIHRVTKSILESLTSVSYSTSLDSCFLQNELRDKLRNKRFLLVLDDVGQDSHLQTLRAPFSVGAEGSKIIFTRNSRSAASVRPAVRICLLTPLSNDDGWSLFCRILSEAGSSIPNPTLESIGKKICTKCGGLPLAIKALAGLLLGTHDITEWEAISHSSLWELPKRMPSLWLSYYYLPPHLKRCFAYCAIFPKGYRIDRKQLVLLWMAENFIVLTDDDRSMEDVGDDYVQQLLGRSFFELLDTSFLTMHDLVHDLAEEVSGHLIARHELKSPHISERARHFSYLPGVFDGIDKFEALHKAVHLRTFLQLRKIVGGTTYLDERYFLTNWVMTVLIPRLECLRVLSLSDYEIFELPESIGHLRQLRYLDVSRTKISLLPKSLTGLYNLQTLLLQDCDRLEMLPADIGQLAFLRHVDIRGTTSLLEMPKRMGRLKNLQTLTAFVVGRNSGSDVKELRELRHIHGNLALRRLQNVATPSDVIEVNLSDWKRIDVVALEFDSVDDDEIEKSRQVQLLENLKPPTNLEELVIRNYVGMRFPKWLEPGCAKYRGMTSLCLSGCLYCRFLPPLGQLPSLKLLKIEGMEHVVRVGHEFYGHNNSNTFQALEGLSFRNMKGWEMWLTADAEGIPVLFPSLKKLSLHDCPILKGNLPIHTPLLEEVEVERCDQLCRLLLQWPSMHTVEVASFVRAEFVNAFDVTSLTILRLVGLAQLVKLPPELTRLSLLRDFRIVSCENLQSLANVKLPPKLEFLEIEQCKVLESFPDDLTSLTHLGHIALKQCPCLSWIPGINLPTSLHRLDVHNCERWEFPIQEKMQQCSSLEQLRLTNTADNLICFPLGVFPNLNVLSFWGCKHIEKVYIPKGVVGESLSSLNVLQIGFCPKLEMVGTQTGRGEATVLPAPNLTILWIRGCPKMKTLRGPEVAVLLPELYFLGIDVISSPWDRRRYLSHFSYLKILTVYSQHVEEFPDGNYYWLPTSIAKLSIIDFPNLRQLNRRTLKGLSLLKELWIEDCPQLQCLPKMGLPSSLGLLNLRGCPKLEDRCRPKGQDWSIIRCLPCVVIDGFLIIPHTPGISVPWSPTQRIYQNSGLMEIDEDVLHYDGRQAAFENAQGGSTAKSKGKMICEDEIGMETNPPASADVELIQTIREDAIEMEGNPAANNEVELVQMSHDLESELRGVIEPKIPDAEQMLTSHDRVGRDPLIKPDTPALISIPDPRNPVGVFEAGPSDKTIKEPEMTSTSFGTDILCQEGVVEVAGVIEPKIPDAEQMLISHDQVGRDTLIKPDIPASISIPDPGNPIGVFEAGPSDETIKEPEMTSTSFGTDILCQEEVVEVAEEMQISNDLEIELNRLVEADIISTPTRDIFFNPKMQASTSVQTCHGESIDQLSVQAESTPQNRILLPSQVNIHRPVHHTVEKILEALKDVQSRRICLHGSGGSGKTTVLRTLSLHPACTNLFDQIIFVSIPRLGRRRKIQHRIAQQLSLNVLESSSADETATQIYDALAGRDRKILLLLDDVWETVNLDEVGIPNPGPENGYWLVFATRSLDNRFDQPSSKIKMEVLSTAESWELFRCEVGNIVDSEIEPYAQAIVEQCHGLPLIISAVGSALEMESNIMEWELAASRFMLFDPSPSRYSASPHIKYCYDRLKAEGAKTCFLYCALFASDREIGISMLVDCFIAEGLLGGRTLAAYKKGHDIVKHLVDASLLEAMANGCKVKMHNIVRETALSILSSSTEGYEILTGSYLRAIPAPRSNMLSSNIDKYLIGADAQLKEPVTSEEWREAEMIFLMDNRLSSLPSQPSCPALEALFLQRNNRLRVIPSSFFDGMNALTILNLTKTRIACLPDSFSKLKNLEVLVLRDCERLYMLPPIIGCLRALKVFDLQGTELTHLPDSVRELASLKQLRVSFYGSVDQEECSTLPAKLIPDGAISLIDLRELGIFVHPGDRRWKSSVSNIIEEMSSLKLSALHIHFPEEEDLDHFVRTNISWNQRNLLAFNFIVGNDYKHAISQVSYDAEMVHDRERRCLRYVNGDTVTPAVEEVLSGATSFYLDHHLTISSLSDFGIQAINALKICILRDCPNIRAILHVKRSSTNVLPCLEYLSVNYLWNLERIWVGQGTAGSLAKLRHMSLQACPKLGYVLTRSMLHMLPNLEELVIEECTSLAYVLIEDEASMEDYTSSKFVEKPSVSDIPVTSAETPILHSLKVLKLHYLPKLSDIWKGRWPPLEYISFCVCPKLRNLHMNADDAKSIKEIVADKAWWDTLKWNCPEVSERLSGSVRQIDIDDL